MKKTTWKSLLAVVFAFMLVFTAIIPAMAAEETTYTITIEPGNHTDTSVAGRFKAYQIFKGKVQSDQDQLANVVWGDGVNVEGLIAALAEAYPDDLGNLASKTNTAKAVADFLNSKYQTDDEGNQTTLTAEFAAEFSKIVEKHVIPGKAHSSTYNEEDGVFEITGLEAGYYLVVDTYSGNNHDAKAGNILEVLNDKTIKMKSQVPEVDKFIVKDTDEALYPADSTAGYSLDGTPNAENDDLYAGTTKGDDYGIGDHVMFRLLGTLPENYDEFTTYYYRFIDHLSAGLDYDAGSVKILAMNDDGDIIDISRNFPTAFEVIYDSAQRVLYIKCDNLKAITGLDNSYTIVVEYTATLNKNAEIADGANENKVQLEYSNNPTNNSHGNTNEEKVYVYTFELDFTKTNSEGDALENVGFKLYRLRADGTKEYAKLTHKTVSEEFTSDWVIEDAATTWTTNIEEATEIFTDDEGKFNIQGLDAGTYYLTETTVLDGYERMTDIVITITATYDDDGTLASYSATYAAREDGIQDVNQTDDMEFTLINFTAAELPSTGGMGTTMFYVIGGIVLACAAVLLIVSKKRTAQKQ